MDWYIIIATFVVSTQGIAIPHSLNTIYKPYDNVAACNTQAAKMIQSLPKSKSGIFKEIKMIYCKQKKANADE